MSKNLILLVADRDIEYGIRGLLSRPVALGIRRIAYDIYSHPRRDPGCAHEAPEFLRMYIRDYERAIVVFDHHGSGFEAVSSNDLAEEVGRQLRLNGWDNRATAIVLDPELEVWVFAGSPHVEECMRWSGAEGLREWLEKEGLWRLGDPKPDHPREALQRALRKSRQPRSPAFYQCLGERVSFGGCVDHAFLTFKTKLAEWFPST